MSIVHVRIDDRLIHGQIATMWTNYLGVTRIMVVDDQAAVDEIQKMSLKMATPSGVALSVFSVERAAERLNGGNYEGQRLMLILKSPDSLERLVDLGVKIQEVNVGNLIMMEGKSKIANTVSINRQELEIFRKLNKQGVKLTLQLIPSVASEDLIPAMEKVFKEI